MYTSGTQESAGSKTCLFVQLLMVRLVNVQVASVVLGRGMYPKEFGEEKLEFHCFLSRLEESMKKATYININKLIILCTIFLVYYIYLYLNAFLYSNIKIHILYIHI